MNRLFRPACWMFGHDWRYLTYRKRVCRHCGQAQKRDDFERWRNA